MEQKSEVDHIHPYDGALREPKMEQRRSLQRSKSWYTREESVMDLESFD